MPFQESVIREMTRLGDEAGAVNLSQGLPDFSPPRKVLEAAVRAIRSGDNQYTFPFGTLAFRRAVAARYECYNRIVVDPETEVTITCGVSEALLATILALTDPGDEVIILEPWYENYVPDCVMAGVHPRFVSLHEPDYTFAEYMARLIGVAVVPGSSFYAGKGPGATRVRLDVRSDCLAHRLDALYILTNGQCTDLHLDRPRAPGGVLCHLVGQFPQTLALDIVAPGDVGRDAIAIAAEQLVQRHVRHFGPQIPQANVDGADGARAQSAAAGQLGHPHLMPQTLDIDRVLTDQEWCEVFDDGTANASCPAETNAGHPCVGLDLDQTQAGMRVGVLAVGDRLGPRPAVRLGGDVGDLHRQSSVYRRKNLRTLRDNMAVASSQIARMTPAAIQRVGPPASISVLACSRHSLSTVSGINLTASAIPRGTSSRSSR